MTDEDLVKNLAWYREEAGLESAYPITHPMSMFIRAIAARERLKNKFVELEPEEILDMANKQASPKMFAMGVAWATAKLKERNT
jgi:hypothetical protein